MLLVVGVTAVGALVFQGARPIPGHPAAIDATAPPERVAGDLQFTADDRRVFDALDPEAQAALLDSPLFREGRVTAGEVLFLRVAAVALGAKGAPDAGDAVWAAAQQFRDGWFSWMAAAPPLDEATRDALRTILRRDPAVYQRAHAAGVFRQFPLSTAKAGMLSRLAVAVTRQQAALVDTLLGELATLP